MAFLCACSNGSQQTTDAGNGNDVATTDDGGSDADGAVAEYCPAGYTLTPFLSDTATTHKFTKADQVADSTKDYVAVLETDAPGRIVWHFHQSTAPLATNSFIFLALHHYFDGIAFHRVITNVIAQGGDPKTLQPNTNTNVWGTGGPGYSFADELTPTPVYSALTVAMAQLGPEHQRLAVFHQHGGQQQDVRAELHALRRRHRRLGHAAAARDEPRRERYDAPDDADPNDGRPHLREVSYFATR